MAALEKHIAAMSSDNLFEGTDFKLASCEDPMDEKVARECGFTSLSVRVVKVLVSPAESLHHSILSSVWMGFELFVVTALAGTGYTACQPNVGTPRDFEPWETPVSR
jgi:hypothetical protein